MRKLIYICVLVLLFILPFSTKLSYIHISNFESNLNIPKPVYPDKKQQNNYIELILEATAYTKSVEEGTSDGITKSGVPVRRGIVAVDPKIIPLGTKLYIKEYGEAIALDTGGAIKGNKIDLYMETKKEAFEFGRRKVKVQIIE